MSVFNLTKEHVKFVDSAANWEEAIDISAQSLLDGDFVLPEYVEAMKASVKKNGPYIVITENVAMPHARPEAGTKKIGYSVTKFANAVSFEEDGSKDAKLFITLSCVDAKTHVSIMEKIVIILSDDDKRNELFTTTSVDTIVDIFNS
jgi:mannitol/fructose-specific phosphotransferase system IIA component (Ntr-type)